MSTKETDSVYKYAGKKYTFSAYIYLHDEYIPGLYIPNNDVIMFLYENLLNNLYLKGELIFIDKYGVFDKFFEQQLVYCQIQNILHDIKYNGDITIETLSKTHQFQHIFIVDTFDIIDRTDKQITYKLKLVSTNWLKCMSNVTYTTYNKTKEEIFDIIKSMITLNDLLIDDNTFSSIKSPVKIDYITLTNDTTLSAVKYLLNKLYYYQSKLQSMIFIVYNETTYKYQLFNITDVLTTNGLSTIVLSMFKLSTESLTTQNKNQLATVTKMPKTQMFKSILTKNFIDYNYQTNKFEDKSIESKEIISTKNEKPLASEDLYQNKYSTYESTMTYKQSGTYWNNDYDIYGDIARDFNEDHSLVVATDAEILRKPGALLAVSLDRAESSVESEELKKYQDTKNRYKAFEGLWFIGKVRHIISPSAQSYTLNLVLFRNFILRKKK